MIIRAKCFTRWMQANFCYQTLKEIAEHGADCGWPKLTWYVDTCKLYNRFKGQIWQMLSDDADDFGLSPIELIASFKAASSVHTATTFENLLTWYAAERTAHRLMETKEEGL